VPQQQRTQAQLSRILLINLNFPFSADHIFANHLQWVIMTDKPWTQGNNIYYAVSAQTTPHHPEAPTIDFQQPTLYFMPNW
jgi:hypothetical protein